MTLAQRERITVLFADHVREKPFVEMRHPTAIWIEPGFYCSVSFLEWTSEGQLRAPVFEGLLDG